MRRSATETRSESLSLHWVHERMGRGRWSGRAAGKGGPQYCLGRDLCRQGRPQRKIARFNQSGEGRCIETRDYSRESGYLVTYPYISLALGTLLAGGQGPSSVLEGSNSRREDEKRTRNTLGPAHCSSTLCLGGLVAPSEPARGSRVRR